MDGQDGKESLPPSYESISTFNGAEPSSSIPGPNRFDTPNFPNEDQIRTHLKVLHGFYKLRQTISKQDGLYDLYGEDVTSCLSSDHKPDSEISSLLENMSSKLEEKRWVIYITRAVIRFAVWIEALKFNNHCKELRISDMTSEKALDDIVKSSGNSVLLTRDDLPPPDILLVWHSFMLNPHLYLEECLRDGLMSLWHQGFPWTIIEASLDKRGESYDPGPAAIKNFEKCTKLKWANSGESPTATIRCAFWGCRKSMTVRCYGGIERAKIQSWAERCVANKTVEDFPIGFGFSDRGFQARCASCLNYTRHELLRAMKFVDDYDKLGHVHVADDDSKPLRGTILDEDGLIKPMKDKQDPRLFPIYFLRTASKYRGPLSHIRSIHKLRVYIENELNDKLVVTEANRNGRYITSESKLVQQCVSSDARKTVRLMMSRYWNNSSPFGLDLVTAVLRQGSFIDKMGNLGWVHDVDPGLRIPRLLKRYERFFEMLSSKSKTLCVPTLDIDLAWHTHQLSPSSYYTFSVGKCGKHVDHDDKIATTKLHSAFKETSILYRKMYREEYSECFCWYCDAVRVSSESFIKSLFGRSDRSNKDAQADLQLSCSKSQGGSEKIDGKMGGPNSNTAHVSSHNAIHPATGNRGRTTITLYDHAVEKMCRDIEAAYTKAHARALKEGRTPPSRPASRTIFPISPAILHHSDQGIHSIDPAWADFTPHGNGNCVGGTCGSNGESGMCGGNLAGGPVQSDCGG